MKFIAGFHVEADRFGRGCRRTDDGRAEEDFRLRGFREDGQLLESDFGIFSGDVQCERIAVRGERGSETDRFFFAGDAVEAKSAASLPHLAMKYDLARCGPGAQRPFVFFQSDGFSLHAEQKPIRRLLQNGIPTRERESGAVVEKQEGLFHRGLSGRFWIEFQRMDLDSLVAEAGPDPAGDSGQREWIVDLPVGFPFASPARFLLILPDSE